MSSRWGMLGVLAGMLTLSACSGVSTPTVTVTVPAPTVTVTVTASPSITAPTPSSSLSDGVRATLDANLGRAWGREGPLGQYCPMDASGRRNIAQSVARQFDGYTPDLVLAYLDEACAELQ